MIFQSGDSYLETKLFLLYHTPREGTCRIRCTLFVLTYILYLTLFVNNLKIYQSSALYINSFIQKDFELVIKRAVHNENRNHHFFLPPLQQVRRKYFSLIKGFFFFILFDRHCIQMNFSKR